MLPIKSGREVRIGDDDRMFYYNRVILLRVVRFGGVCDSKYFGVEFFSTFCVRVHIFS